MFERAVTLLWGALCVLLLAAGIFAYLGKVDAERQAERLRTTLAQTRAEAAATAASATAAYRALEARWRSAQETIDRDARARQDQIRAAAAAGALAGDGLRLRAAATATAACGGAPAPSAAAPAVGPAASSPAALLADVLGRLEEAGRQLAEVADTRGLAGQSCERAYNELQAQSRAVN